MKYHINPKNGDKISVLEYDCTRFSRTAGIAVNQKKTETEMLAALEAGMNYFDTAYIYPGSESAIGKFLARGYRNKLFLATKLPHQQCRSKEDFEKSFPSNFQDCKPIT